MKTTVKAVLERLKSEDHPMFEGVATIELNGRYGAFQETPLHILAVQGDLDGCKLLLEAGAQIDLPGEQGYTALHEAVHQGHSQLAKLLLDHGSDPRLETLLGATDFLAQDYPEIVAMLKDHQDTEHVVGGNGG